MYMQYLYKPFWSRTFLTHARMANFASDVSIQLGGILQLCCAPWMVNKTRWLFWTVCVRMKVCVCVCVCQFKSWRLSHRCCLGVCFHSTVQAWQQFRHICMCLRYFRSSHYMVHLLALTNVVIDLGVHVILKHASLCENRVSNIN